MANLTLIHATSRPGTATPRAAPQPLQGLGASSAHRPPLHRHLSAASAGPSSVSTARGCRRREGGDSAVPGRGAESADALAGARRPQLQYSSVLRTALSAGLAASLMLPGAAVAGEGAIPLDLFRHFLDKVESLGPLGGLFFTTSVTLAEMIPLFPTQPLSLAAGLLFGPFKGAGLVLAGNVAAATSAFLLARGVGRPLAEKVIKMETEENGKGTGMLANVQDVIKNGSEFNKFMSILFLRLTPVVPFSASNYVLGLSPVGFLPFFTGTAAGMAPWAILFASLGSAGRQLLDGGEEFSEVFAKLAGKASAYTEGALAAAAVVAAIAAGVWVLRRSLGAGEDSGAGQEDLLEDAAAGVANERNERLSKVE